MTYGLRSEELTSKRQVIKVFIIISEISLLIMIFIFCFLDLNSTITVSFFLDNGILEGHVE